MLLFKGGEPQWFLHILYFWGSYSNLGGGGSDQAKEDRRQNKGTKKKGAATKRPVQRREGENKENEY